MTEPYYQNGLVTLYHGDCLDVLPTLRTNSVEAIFADPPYNLGFQYDEYDDTRPWPEYINWCRQWFIECRRIAVGSVVITPGLKGLPLWLSDIEQTHYVMAWTKTNSMKWNHIGPVAGTNCWEPILVYNRSVVLVPRDHIDCPSSVQADTADHPCPKPLKLMTSITSSFTSDHGSILDPFAGSGSTLIAARLLNRSAIGIELSERYCEIIANRLSQGSFFDLLSEED